MDRDLLARALRPLVPELTSFARWLVGSGREADELVHTVVLRALEHAEGIEDASRLRAWLFRTARNARVDLLRAGAARSRLMVLDGGLEDLVGVTVPADPLPAMLDRVDVETALAKLPETARAAEIDGSIAGLDAALPAAERSREVAEQALAAVAARAEAGAVPQVDVETTRAVLRRTQMRARMLRLGLDGLRARRAILTTSLPSR